MRRSFFLVLCVSSLFLFEIACRNSTKPPDSEITKWKLVEFENETIASIAIDPTDPRIIFVGSNSDFSAGTPGRLFKSTDSGHSWDTLIYGQSAKFRRVIIDPSNSNIVYALPQSILKSVNGGLNWTDITNGIRIDFDTRVSSFAIDPTNSSMLYAGTGGFMGGTLYKSTDAGTTWIKTLPDSIGDGVASLAIDPHDHKRIFAGTALSGRLLLSTNAGNNWRTSIPSNSGIVDFIEVSPTKTNLIFAGIRFRGLYISSDGGSTWNVSHFSDSIQGFNGMAFDPLGRPGLYLATNMGPYHSNCDTCDWIAMVEGLSSKSVNVIAAPNSDLLLYIGKSKGDNDPGGLYVRPIN